MAATRQRDAGPSSSAGASASRRRREGNGSFGAAKASGNDNSKKSALSAAYAELGKELTSGKLRSIGAYTLGRPIGEGTYGKVRLGTHRLTGLRVAIKQVPKAHSANLTREIHHHRHLHHPHVMQLYEVLATESYIWMVSELCAGGELYDYLVERGVMPEPEARRIFGQLCLAVAYIHERGIVHRDLKLENVLLDERCNVKLGDFGFTREFEGKRLMETFCGTTGYAAPEMLAGRKYTGEEVDVWSLGIILYALVFGALPFDDDDEGVMKAKILDGDFELPEIISPECIALIRSILRQDPTTRPTIKEILSSPWFTKVIVPSHMMATVDEDVADNDGLQAEKALPSYRVEAGIGDVGGDGAPVLDVPPTNVSNTSFHSVASHPESELSDYRSSITDSTAPTTAGGMQSEEGDVHPHNVPQPSKPLSLQHRNESQTTIRRQASASSDGSRKAQLALPKSGSMLLSTHLETPMESSPDEPLFRSVLQSAPLEKRGSQSSARSGINHRTPSRTKRRSSGGLSEHHPPTLETRPVDYVALLERSTPAIFSTVLEQNLLHQLSSLGMDVGQIVHSIVNEACDASGAMWWLLKKKEEDRVRIERDAGLASVPSSPYIGSKRQLSPAPSIARERRQTDTQDRALPTSNSGVSLIPEAIRPLSSDKGVDATPVFNDATTATHYSTKMSGPLPDIPPRRSSPLVAHTAYFDASAPRQSTFPASLPEVPMPPPPAAPVETETKVSPTRNRATSLSARISQALAGKDKDKDGRREATPELPNLVTSQESQSDERGKSSIGGLFGVKRSNGPPVGGGSEARKGKEKADETAVMQQSVSTVSFSDSADGPARKTSMTHLEPTKSVETFSTVASNGDGDAGDTSRSSRRSGKGSFLNTVRSWLGSDSKTSTPEKQKPPNKKSKAKRPPLAVQSPRTSSVHVARSGSIRRYPPPSPMHAVTPHHAYGTVSSRQRQRSGPRGQLSRTNSAGSAYLLPMASRPVSMRRQSGGSVTPTPPLHGLIDDAWHPRTSRPSSAQSHHRNSASASSLRGKSGSVGSIHSRSRINHSGSGTGSFGSQLTAGNKVLRTSQHRASLDSGTTVRRHRQLSHSRPESRSQSRPTTPTKGLFHSGDVSLDTVTPRRSLDSGRASPIVTPAAMSHHSIFVAHRNRHPHKHPSTHSAHRHDSDNKSNASTETGLPTHARPRGMSEPHQRRRATPGSWRRSWGKPPPTWSGPVDHAREDSTSSRIAEAQARDKAQSRDVFSKRDVEDDWEDEEDEPQYAGGLGQMPSGAWKGDAHDSLASPRPPLTEAAVRSAAMDDGPWNARRKLFQPPSLGRETAPRSWITSGPGAGTELDVDKGKAAAAPEGAPSGKDGVTSTPAGNTAGGAGSRIRSAAPVFAGQSTITEEEEDE